MTNEAPQPSSNGDGLASDPRWARLVAEWFEEQAALVVAELEQPGGTEPEAPHASGAEGAR